MRSSNPVRRFSTIALSVVVGWALALSVATAWAAAPVVRDVAAVEQLSDVACPSPTRCLAVGDDLSTSPARRAIVPFTVSGESFQVGPAQLLDLPSDFVVRALACPSPAACLAVGNGDEGAQAVVVPLAVHDATVTVFAAQSIPMGAGTSDLLGVACPSTTRCLAVGNASARPDEPSASRGLVVPLVLTSDGVAVGVARTTGPATGLWGIACPTPDNCLAVGSTLAAGPGAAPRGLVVTVHPGNLAADVGAVASAPMSNHLYSVACASPTFCLGGGDDDTSGVIVPLALSGTDTSIAPSDVVASTSSVERVACSSSASCLGTGANDAQALSIPLVTNGASVDVGAAQPLAGTSSLPGLACLASGPCLVVGSVVPGGGPGSGVAALLPSPS